MKTCLQILCDARSKIANIENWTRGSFYRTIEGYGQDWPDDTTYKYCAVGSLRVVSGTHGKTDEAIIFLGSLFPRTDGDHESISKFNDSSGHKAVLDLFDLAISLKRKDEIVQGT